MSNVSETWLRMEKKDKKTRQLGKKISGGEVWKSIPANLYFPFLLSFRFLN